MSYALDPRVRQLCLKTSEEQDPVELLRLITELNNLLEGSDECSSEPRGDTSGGIAAD